MFHFSFDFSIFHTSEPRLTQVIQPPLFDAHFCILDRYQASTPPCFSASVQLCLYQSSLTKCSHPSTSSSRPDQSILALTHYIHFPSGSCRSTCSPISPIPFSVILDPSQSYRQVLARGTAASHLIIQGTFALLHVDTDSLDNFTHNSVICAPFLTFLGSEWSYCSAHPSYGHVLSKHIVSIHKSIPIPLTPRDIIFASPSTSRVPYAVMFHLEHDLG